MNSSLEKILQIIPQFYYDLIARAVPGAVACILYGISFKTDLNLPSLNNFNVTLLFALVFIASYLIGILLDYFSEGVLEIFSLLPNVSINDSFLWAKIISLENSKQESILTKMMGEKTLLRVLLVVFLPFLFFGKKLFPKMEILEPRTIVGLILLILIIGFITLHFCIKARLKDCKWRKTVNKALNLSPEERSELVHELILSLDDVMDTEAERAWDAEIERRVKEIKTGKAKGRPSADILAEIRAKYS